MRSPVSVLPKQVRMPAHAVLTSPRALLLAGAAAAVQLPFNRRCHLLGGENNRGEHGSFLPLRLNLPTERTVAQIHAEDAFCHPQTLGAFAPLFHECL